MEERGLQDALLRRVRAATEQAVRVTARARLLVHTSEQLHDGGLTSRCAWCGRYEVGGEWISVGRMPSFALRASASHTICPDCVDDLRASGRSV